VPPQPRRRSARGPAPARSSPCFDLLVVLAVLVGPAGWVNARVAAYLDTATPVADRDDELVEVRQQADSFVLIVRGPGVASLRESPARLDGVTRCRPVRGRRSPSSQLPASMASFGRMEASAMATTVRQRWSWQTSLEAMMLRRRSRWQRVRARLDLSCGLGHHPESHLWPSLLEGPIASLHQVRDGELVGRTDGFRRAGMAARPLPKQQQAGSACRRMPMNASAAAGDRAAAPQSDGGRLARPDGPVLSAIQYLPVPIRDGPCR
jgi:hypothetical protein